MPKPSTAPVTQRAVYTYRGKMLELSVTTKGKLEKGHLAAFNVEGPQIRHVVHTLIAAAKAGGDIKSPAHRKAVRAVLMRSRKI